MKRLLSHPALLLSLFVAMTVIPLLGNAYLFDWDEVNFAECAREMIVTGDYLHPRIDYEPFWEKPPLFFWLQALAMNLFGINEFAARLPNAIVGIVTVAMLVIIGKRWVDSTFGMLWGLVWIGSLLPQFYMHTGLIDPLFNLLMVASAICALESITSKNAILLACSGLLLGLAVLTKGPIALALVGIPLLALWLRCAGWKHTLRDAGIVAVIAVLPFTLWLASDRSSWGQWFMQSFLDYQLRLLTTGDAGHHGPLYYHIAVLLLGCFPASWLALKAYRPKWRIEDLADASFTFAVMLVVVVVIFSIVQTKIIHYSSLAYFPLTFFAAQVLYRWWYSPNKAIVFLIAAGSIILGILFILTPIILANRPLLEALARDTFARSIVQTAVPQWRGIEWAAGALVLSATLTAFIAFRWSPRSAVVILLLSNALGVSAFLRVVAPRIQDFTQRELVEFCRRYAQSDVILHPVGFKTYVHLFYGRRKFSQSPPGNSISRSQWEAYLLDGPIRTDVIFIAKRVKAGDLLRRKDFVQLDDPNSAWLFLLRPAKR
ncbi:MAG: glycosyltransferase family 39 protein [Bacteroidota bacterium]|nr:glycosyltransferase family 39 protein [Candidatus Kapabacteria bacterium]MDW8270949.1 glycosyltransferase family 39 protein [Bacteroidota bacterium]